jgi:prefoldin subunit 5
MAEASSSAAQAEPKRTVIPAARFIDDVGSLLEGKNADTVLETLQENLRQYRMVESTLLQRRARLMGKLPEISQALDAVQLLIRKGEAGEQLELDFQLADQVYSKAKVKDPDTVALWLGANVMLEYTLEDAKNLLEENLQKCKSDLDANQRDLDFVKDSQTTTEVSLARVYNYDVVQRKGKSSS